VRESNSLNYLHAGNPKAANRRCIAGYRISVSDVFGVPWPSGMRQEDILADFPDLRVEASSGCLELRAHRENA